MLPLGHEGNFRYNELMKEAEQYHLAKQVAIREHSIHVRTLQSLGDTLILLGKSLKSLSLSL
jgi:hypothetical protein